MTDVVVVDEKINTEDVGFLALCVQLRELEEAYGAGFGAFDDLVSEGAKALVEVGFVATGAGAFGSVVM